MGIFIETQKKNGKRKLNLKNRVYDKSQHSKRFPR
jgi:hypothetical protein